MTLTERETKMLALLLSIVSRDDEPAKIGEIADRMAYVKQNGKGHKHTDNQRRKHAKGILTILKLKLQVEGIELNRTSRLGTGAEAEYDFTNKNHRNAAKRLLKESEKALFEKDLGPNYKIVPPMFAANEFK